MLKTVGVVIGILLMSANIADAATWETVAKESSQREMKQSKDLLDGVAKNLTYIRRLVLTESLDIEKTLAHTTITQSLSPNAKLFEGRSFIDVLNEQIIENFNVEHELTAESLANGLDNAVQANGLFSALVNVHPIGAALSNALSVVNGLLDQKGGFFKSLFTPNYEKQYAKFQKGIRGHLRFYNSMDVHIENSKKSFEGFRAVISSDARKIKQLFDSYESVRTKIVGDGNGQKELLEYIYAMKVDDVSPDDYIKFSSDKNVQELIELSKEIKAAEIDMSYGYLTFNKTALTHINSWMNELKTNPLTVNNSSPELKGIIDDLHNASTNMEAIIAEYEAILSDRDNLKSADLGEKTVNMVINEGFFALTPEGKNKLRGEFPGLME